MIYAIIYFIIGILMAVYYTNRLKRNESDIYYDELIAYFIACILFWPLFILIDSMI